MVFIRRLVGRRRICFSSSIALMIITLITTLYSFMPLEEKFSETDNNVLIMLSESEYQKEYINKKGVHVIVGQYNGKSSNWNGSPNLTDDILNANNYDPLPQAGEGGSAVYIPDYEKAKMKALYYINKFNILASDRISVKRWLPDPRKQSCRSKEYSNPLGNASIIIVFHNEAWSTLLRTVHSVINTSPKNVLHEIILVDDASTRKFLKQELDDYIKNLTRSSRVTIKVLRSAERIGLIRARLIGAKVATGKVLTFLDAHCEATIGWLEPLLDRIARNRTRVVCPVIDIIQEETFAFARSFELHIGGINWNLHFRWYPLDHRELIRRKKSKKESSEPFKTPIMAGGLFAIERQFFWQIGGYDEFMDIWGGENIELSLRVWQCGASLEIVPCSHVAHVFRKSSPYSFPRADGVTGVLYTNLARVLHVWMDREYQNFFYKINPVMKSTIFGEEINGMPDLQRPPTKLVNITERIRLKEKLGCQSFSWFLNNVWTEHFFPTQDRFFGKIMSNKLSECLQRPGASGGPSNNHVGKLELDKCMIEMFSPQCFIYTRLGVIMTDESVCLDVIGMDSSSPTVLLLACFGSLRQRWVYDREKHNLKHVQSNSCLEIDSQRRLTISKCSDRSSQKWTFVPVSWSEP